jgi:hypothetical protein
VVEELRGYLAGRPADRPVWPGTWYKRAADMLRIDLDAAGVPYVVEGPDGPLHADFHALRHSYIALLDRTGATLKEAMRLARHSDPKLTMAVYGRAQLHDLSETVQRLPSLLDGPDSECQVLKGTGTEPVCTGFAQPNDTGRNAVKLVEAQVVDEGGKSASRNPLQNQEVEAGCDSMRLIEEAPRPGLEPGTNRLTGESIGVTKKCRTPLRRGVYSIPLSFASACGRLRGNARKCLFSAYPVAECRRMQNRSA